MFEEELEQHKILFSGPSLELGKAHWFILKAQMEMDRKSYQNEEDDSSLTIKPVSMVVTPFGEELEQDEIYWWIFKKEKNIDELYEKTRDTLNPAQKLKEDSLIFETKFLPSSYIELVNGIKKFTEDHASEIRAIRDYIFWLVGRDILAPKILFAYRVWGSTRLSDRIIKVGEAIDKDDENLNKCTELALGLRTRVGYSIGGVYWEMLSDIVESYDPENRPKDIKVPEDAFLIRITRDVLSHLATYFEFIRQSLRNILIDAEKYRTEARLLYNLEFWKRFVRKAMDGQIVETQLWDFKNTLEMWHCQPEKKTEWEIDFAEQVGSYANADGGVLIMGITDKFPRTVVGIEDLENKIKSAKDALN
ncbi:MAG TPA: RNA-binding domain-containing protein, partial [Acidobacteriota bacterium]|nr:RNA-binding domain-containing protein [Acidobacteriota bacterium]